MRRRGPGSSARPADGEGSTLGATPRIVGVAVVLHDGERVWHGYNAKLDGYEHSGGKLEQQDDTAKWGAIREVLEEADISNLQPHDLRFVGYVDGQKHCICLVYVARLPKGVVPRARSGEHIIRWDPCWIERNGLLPEAVHSEITKKPIKLVEHCRHVWRDLGEEILDVMTDQMKSRAGEAWSEKRSYGRFRVAGGSALHISEDSALVYGSKVSLCGKPRPNVSDRGSAATVLGADGMHHPKICGACGTKFKELARLHPDKIEATWLKHFLEQS